MEKFTKLYSQIMTDDNPGRRSRFWVRISTRHENKKGLYLKRYTDEIWEICYIFLVRIPTRHENMKGLYLKRCTYGIWEIYYIFYYHVNPQTKPKRSRCWQAVGFCDARGLFGLVFVVRAGCAGWLQARGLLAGAGGVMLLTMLFCVRWFLKSVESQ